jgi:hypothetical protein
VTTRVARLFGGCQRRHGNPFRTNRRGIERRTFRCARHTSYHRNRGTRVCCASSADRGPTPSAVDPTGWMYIQWKTLCGYVHPSSTTAAIYAHEKPDGSVEWHREPEGVPDRALLFSLALSMTLAAAPLLDLVKSKPHKTRLTKIAEAAHVPLWAREEGKPPGTTAARRQACSPPLEPELVRRCHWAA